MSKDAQTRFHEEWLGLAQPYEGLVFSVPVLADAQITPEVDASLTARYRSALVQPEGDDPGHYGDLRVFFESFLGYASAALPLRANLPEELHFYAQEGQQDVRPSFAIARSLPAESEEDLFGSFGEEPKDEKTATGAGTSTSTSSSATQSPYLALVWDLRDDAGEDALGLDLDAPEDRTGPWRYPPTAKFERLLRASGVPVGLLSNGRDLRLVYAPAGESTSHLTFRGDVMQRPEGRPVLAAFELLLSASRTYGAAEQFTVAGLLRESRGRQADVTKKLAEQVFEAVELLLRGFEAAGNRDASSGRPDWLRAALEEPHDHAYQGVLSVVLRLVFLLYAEDQSLLPVQHPTYARFLSVKGLYDELVDDAGQHPESMNNRFGAYGRLLSLFRAVFLGVEHGELRLPPRRGRLFDPNSYPFLEGGLPGTTAAIALPEDRAATRPPSVDDGTVYEVLHRLVFFEGQRLSYASLDVEQLGSVYESLMGFHVLRVQDSAVRLKSGLWVELGELRRMKSIDLKKHLKEQGDLSAAQCSKVEQLLNEHKNDDTALLEALNDFSPGGKKERHLHVASAGRLVLQPGEERRRSGSHYTPRSLTQGIVERTLEPLLECMGDEPSEEQLLSLKICDPAMGSGAFLVEVVRQLAQQLVALWTRTGKLAEVVAQAADPELVARRVVAQRCVYGVDKNPAAVELAKLSLWLVTLSADLPFTFVDHALRHGDSLVGLSLDQIASFHWKPEKQVDFFREVLKESLEEALEHRAELLMLAADDTPRSQEERRRLLDHAEQATDRIRTIADLCVGAFFAEQRDKAREAERVRRMDLAKAWLEGDASVEPQARSLAAETRERLSPFHWMLEFPEVFYLERPDPLDGMKVNGAAMMDAFVGNPPFMGGKTISTNMGDAYTDWLVALHDAGKNGDYSAHFFRRAANLLGAHGTIGLIATNTIGQGDTRAAGLQFLVGRGLCIYSARADMPWPGEAAVTVSVVHLAAGRATKLAELRINDVPVDAINSRLRPTQERADPIKLRSSEALTFQGSIVLGMGFTLTPEERDTLIQQNPKNAERIFPYLGGEEVNSSPTQSHSRYVISFGQIGLEEAERWPDLIEIVRAKVKPEREKTKNGEGSKLWWQHWRSREVLYQAIAPLERCFVTARVSKHLMFAAQPIDRIFSEQLYVFPLEAHSAFATLQSRIHEVWARLLSSSMKTDLRYAASDCFETFSFPQPDPRTVLPELEEVGGELYKARAKYMVDTDQGLTKTYNALKDPACDDPRILELRALHEELDRAVLRAYPKLPGVGSNDPNVVGWSDIAVPPFCIATNEDRAALQAFEDEVIDRLFVLNELRAKEEAAEAANAGGKALKRPAAKKASKPSQGQGSLF